VTENIEFWRDVYGFDMTAMQEKICEDILVRHMPQKSLAGSSTPFAVLPLHSITVNELDFVKNFQVTLNRGVDSLDGWLVYFDTFFLTSRTSELPIEARAETWASSANEGVAFTTGPQGKETHWKSGIMLVDRTKKKLEALGSGTSIKGTIEYRKGKVNSRGGRYWISSRAAMVYEVKLDLEERGCSTNLQKA
jgi:protein arginine N-methyltransferase 3